MSWLCVQPLQSNDWLLSFAEQRGIAANSCAMDPDKRAKLVAMELDDTPPPQAPSAPQAKPLPPRALAFLDGPTDEHRVAGLLLSLIHI